jgi:hypothetical protein
MEVDQPEIRQIKRDSLEGSLRDAKNDWNDFSSDVLARIFASVFTSEEWSRINELMFVIRQKEL